MVSEGEAVRLITESLQHEQPPALGTKGNGIDAVGNENTILVTFPIGRTTTGANHATCPLLASFGNPSNANLRQSQIS